MQIDPVTWYNLNGPFSEIFKELKLVFIMKNENEVAFMDPTDLNSNPNLTTFKNYLDSDKGPGYVQVKKNNPWKIPIGRATKFMILTEVKFKGDWQAAMSYVSHYLIGTKTNYIRVGCDFFKVISKDTQYGGTLTYPKPWKKETITDDHTKALIPLIPKFDDFIIVPDNKQYQPVIKNCYNLYSPFPHKPFEGEVTEADIPVTINFLKHIFQEHYNLAIQTYLKVMYENPRHKLPILCLVSKTNETGKTTFLNFLEMIFGGNYVLVTPDDLTKQFNASFATKNIIAAEEAFIEKSQGYEKIKALATDKSIQMSRKFIDDQTLPFYGKIILCTNKVKDFMKISTEEIRFWVREVPPIKGKKNNLIEKHLFAEIPKFLKFLDQQPPIDYENGSRQLLSQDIIKTDALLTIKEESRSWLYKEIEILITDYFNNNPTIKEFKASASDIKEEWFRNNNQVTMGFIRKVLSDEAEYKQLHSPSGGVIKYFRFGRDTEPATTSRDYKTGTPYQFIRQNEVEVDVVAPAPNFNQEDLPF